MTDTTTFEPAAAAGEKPRRSGALTAMRLAELQGLASSMGISGTAKMRKGDLIEVIRAKQSGAAVGGSRSSGRAIEGAGSPANGSSSAEPQSAGSPANHEGQATHEGQVASGQPSRRVSRRAEAPQAQAVPVATQADRKSVV